MHCLYANYISCAQVVYLYVFNFKQSQDVKKNLFVL